MDFIKSIIDYRKKYNQDRKDFNYQKYCIFIEKEINNYLNLFFEQHIVISDIDYELIFYINKPIYSINSKHGDIWIKFYKKQNKIHYLGYFKYIVMKIYNLKDDEILVENIIRNYIKLKVLSNLKYIPEFISF